ncbi:hypothetical protein KIS4809_0410 [Bacillus sp. ZZV12-4809]|nr:hypothetical protein KIS4809_0410 [Bacillus sp. ZZV12-4809]
MKKSIMMFVIATLAIMLSACGEETSKEDEPKKEEVQEQKEKAKEPAEEKEEKAKEEETAEAAKIDTSMYQYAKNIDVTDALEINNHITLMIDMNPKTNQGMAFQHVLNDTYDFLLQDSVQQADTVGINVRQDGVKIAMFTVHPKEFVENDEIPMADLVLQASIVDMMTDEVKAYAEAMELPVKTKQ